MVEARLIGALEIEQREDDGSIVRNDRLLAVAANARLHKGIHEITDLSGEMLHEIEHFFSSYNSVKGGEIKVLHRVGSKKAHTLLAQALV